MNKLGASLKSVAALRHFHKCSEGMIKKVTESSW